MVELLTHNPKIGGSNPTTGRDRENGTMLPTSRDHRYLKNIDCLSFVVCPLLAPHLLRHCPSFAAAINSTNDSKQGRLCMPLSSLYYLDVYGRDQTCIQIRECFEI